MREMHKWKDKVEFNLDNRQIFFLFFGLSVVGCFVFAMGVMVGRRVDFGAAGEVTADHSDSLAMLGEALAGEELEFKQGLKEPAMAPPAPEPPEVGTDEPEPEPGAAAPHPTPADDSIPAAVAAPARRAEADSADGAGRKFTLQMKAFAKAEEAEAFADELRARGHEVRVEGHEIKGRIWHRVRVGEFDSWADGLAAKDAFEHAEKTIAYVVRK